MSKPWAYYSEWNPHAAQWLRNLISRGLIAPGEVDERSVLDVAPDDLRSFTQCHFFAGIGVWSYALRRAGWPDDRPVWSGSCPCQPFSAAGAGGGFDDERHLWPAWHWLIEQRRPVRIYGEQVANGRGLAWLDLVQSDLEGSRYASRAIDLSVAGVGAPHIRQRTFFVATDKLAEEGMDNSSRRERLWLEYGENRGRDSEHRCELYGLADASSARFHGAESRPEGFAWDEAWLRLSGPGRGLGCMGDALHPVRRSIGLNREDGRDWSDGRRAQAYGEPGASSQVRELGDARDDDDDGLRRSGELDDGGRPGPTNGLWGDADWLFCTDGKWRAVESFAQPMAHGTSGRVGQSGAYKRADEDEKCCSVVRDLRGEAGTQTVRRQIGGLRSLQDTEALRPGMHGPVDGGSHQSREREEQPPPVREGGEDGVRGLRADRGAVSRSPRGREPSEQHVGQPSDPMPVVPQEYSFPLVDGSKFREGSGSVFDGKSRAKMLAGYGNAINSEVAAWFIRASN